MSLIKKLAGETVIYGLSSILGRALGFLLVYVYTNLFPKEEYGVVSYLYSIVGFLMVVYIYRMDTAFFRYGSDKEKREDVFSTTFWSVSLNSLLLSLLIFVFADEIAGLLTTSTEHSIYIRILSLVLAFDTLAEIPFARLRLENKAIRFATIRLIGIALNIGLNLFFLLLCPWFLEKGFLDGFLERIYNESFGVGYIFLSNLIASTIVLLLLLPEIFRLKWDFNKELWRTMFLYAAPLILASFAGIVNEMIDRHLLVNYLPYDKETNIGQQGVYSACYKLAMLMSLFTQAFRYAAEPFFFSNAKHKDAKEIYAIVTKYFTIAGVIGFLGITFYLEIFKHLIGEEYWGGLGIVPILLMANLFLGLYYNVSIWYKLTDHTMLGGLIALGGAIVTVILNIWWIPMLGYIGSAWATLVCYFSMAVACWWWGKKYYPVKYDLKRMFLYIALGLSLFVASNLITTKQNLNLTVSLPINTFLLGLFLITVWNLERKELSNLK